MLKYNLPCLLNSLTDSHLNRSWTTAKFVELILKMCSWLTFRALPSFHFVFVSLAFVCFAPSWLRGASRHHIFNRLKKNLANIRSKKELLGGRTQLCSRVTGKGEKLNKFAVDHRTKYVEYEVGVVCRLSDPVELWSSIRRKDRPSCQQPSARAHVVAEINCGRVSIFALYYCVCKPYFYCITIWGKGVDKTARGLLEAFEREREGATYASVKIRFVYIGMKRHFWSTCRRDSEADC